MFRTSENWEAESWAEQARKIYEPGTRGYRVVDVTYRHRYHIDLKYVPIYDELPHYYTFIANHINDVITFINNSEYIDVRISIQSAFNQSEDYVISRVVEIIEAIDEDEKSYIVCKCQDGRNYTTPLLTDDATVLQYKDRVWKCPPIRNTEGKS